MSAPRPHGSREDGTRTDERPTEAARGGEPPAEQAPAGGAFAGGASRPSVLDVDVTGRSFTAADGSVLHAVGALRFSLEADSFTCIVGPSGCGKTTTLRMILGLDDGYRGSVRLAGGGTVAAVFQEPRLLPWRTVEQNVRLALPAARRDAPLDALFEALGLAELRGFYPAELSLGLARRAALARAFALEPALIVLDEPFVSLDEPTAERLRELLLSLWRARPTTALMVTHNAREAALLADRILVFGERPTRVVDVVELPTPRAARTEADVAATVARLRSIAGGGASG